MPSQRIFAEARDVEAAFYEALERADLEAMMQVWCDDEEIICVHPGGPRLVGYSAVREAWRRVFEVGARLSVELSAVSITATPFATVHSLIGRLRLRDQQQNAAVLAVTNVYVRGAVGWRLLAHHASPVPPESVADTPPAVLH